MELLIIKLGAMGDVLRTTPILTSLKSKYPGCKITWLVDPKSSEVLQGNSLIDELVELSKVNLSRLEKQTFDLAMNFDKEKPALDAIMRLSAKKKAGFGWSPKKDLCALDSASNYAYRLGIDDELKFRKNQKTYQAITFEQAGLSFNGEEYILPLGDQEISYARSHLKKLGVNLDDPSRFIVGLNTGSGSRFAGKKLPISAYVALAQKFCTQMSAVVLLLGGKEEIQRNGEIQTLSRVPVINTGSHSIKQFASMVRECDVVVSGDTIAMHVAIAVKVPVVAFFASTCAAEIELYGRGKKLMSNINCAPCYLRDCPIDEKCMKEMGVDIIFDSVRDVLEGISV